MKLELPSWVLKLSFPSLSGWLPELFGSSFGLPAFSNPLPTSAQVKGILAQWLTFVTSKSSSEVWSAIMGLVIEGWKKIHPVLNPFMEKLMTHVISPGASFLYNWVGSPFHTNISIPAVQSWKKGVEQFNRLVLQYVETLEGYPKAVDSVPAGQIQRALEIQIRETVGAEYRVLKEAAQSEFNHQKDALELQLQQQQESLNATQASFAQLTTQYKALLLAQNAKQSIVSGSSSALRAPGKHVSFEEKARGEEVALQSPLVFTSVSGTDESTLKTTEGRQQHEEFYYAVMRRQQLKTAGLPFRIDLPPFPVLGSTAMCELSQDNAVFNTRGIEGSRIAPFPNKIWGNKVRKV